MGTRLAKLWRGGGTETVGPSPGVREEPHAERGGTRDAWLDVLCKLLRMPRAETLAIREELAEHLRERVRDLMLEGVAEEEATGRAISELGDAATLADKFRRADREPRRRLLMNIAMMTLACGVAIGGAVGLNQLSGPPAASGTEARPGVRYASTEVAEKTITLPADATLERFAQELGKAAGKQVFVDWESLQSLDAARDSAVGVPMVNVSVETALMLVNERMGKNAERIACRLTGDLLEVSTLRHFDRRDITLVAYDASSVLGAIGSAKDRSDTTRDLRGLITSVIDSTDWKENGGDLAEIYIVGTKLFVHAPARFHPTVQWILTQVSAGKTNAAAVGDRVPAPVSHVAKAGETWRSVAAAELGDAELWMALAWANGGWNPSYGDLLREGQTVRMPDAEARAAKYVMAPASPAEFRAQHVNGPDDWKQLVKLNPRLEVDWIAGQVLRMPGGERRIAAAVASLPGKVGEAMEEPGTYSITGQVERPGVYLLPKGGLSLRRAIVASGGKFEGVKEVVVTSSENGYVNVVHRVAGETLRKDGGQDPIVVKNQIVEVK